MELSFKWSKELARYCVVGAITNILGYLMFVIFTSLGLSPVLTISILYPIQLILVFFLNKKWSFKHQGQLSIPAIRFFFSYIACYFFNVATLEFFNRFLGYSHLVVQAIGLPIFALFLFIAQKYWVFKSQKSPIVYIRPS